MPIQWRWSLQATTPVVPVPKNGSSTTSPGFELARIDAVEQRFRFLGGVGFSAVDAQALFPVANGQIPVTAHLQIFVERFHRVMVEGVADSGLLFAPRSGFRAHW